MIKHEMCNIVHKETTMQIELNKPRRRPAGFTLIELLVVITIIAILGAAVAPKLLRNPEKARVARAQADIKSLQLQADTFQLDKGRAISSIQELVPDYIEEVPKDPWGGDYTIEARNDGSVRIRCANYEAKKALLEGASRQDGAIGAGAGSP